MKAGFNHVAGKGCTVVCRGGCATELPGGPWPTIDGMFAAMAEHGWIKGPDICYPCQSAYGMAEAAGWLETARDTPDAPQPVRRRRKVRRLL